MIGGSIKISILNKVGLQGSLEHAKLSIKKLQKLFDIIPSRQRKKSGREKNINAKNEHHYDDEDVPSANENIANTTAKTKSKKGRIAKSEYSNVEEIVIAHTELKAGDPCPLAYCTGKLYKLTRFLTVEGCPLSNNKSERTLKIIIRLRKSSLFHKTEYGARVAATMLSLIQTAIDHNLNPADYLTDLLQNT